MGEAQWFGCGNHSRQSLSLNRQLFMLPHSRPCSTPALRTQEWALHRREGCTQHESGSEARQRRWDTTVNTWENSRETIEEIMCNYMKRWRDWCSCHTCRMFHFESSRTCSGNTSLQEIKHTHLQPDKCVYLCEQSMCEWAVRVWVSGGESVRSVSKMLKNSFWGHEWG